MSVKMNKTDSEIIFEREDLKSSSKADGTVVRISSEAHAMLSLWQARTGFSVTRLASEFIIFAAERSRMEE